MMDYLQIIGRAAALRRPCRPRVRHGAGFIYHQAFQGFRRACFINGPGPGCGGNSHVKRFIKRAVIKWVQPPLRVCVNLAQRVLAMENQPDGVVTRADFHTTGEYLSYCQRKIVDDVHQQYGHILVPGTLTGRPHYARRVLNGAFLAEALGMKRISAIEFGVAGGNGLVILEVIAREVAELMGVEVDVYGFDTGKGYPKPVDYRDSPNLFQESDYP